MSTGHGIGGGRRVGYLASKGMEALEGSRLCLVPAYPSQYQTSNSLSTTHLIASTDTKLVLHRHSSLCLITPRAHLSTISVPSQYHLRIISVPSQYQTSNSLSVAPYTKSVLHRQPPLPSTPIPHLSTAHPTARAHVSTAQYTAPSVPGHRIVRV
eukprot:1778257-Rhodomonas_salina.2